MLDLLSVGPQKPVGYLPINTVRKAGWSPKRVLEWAENKGLEARIFAKDECHVGTGAVYVWHLEALTHLLELNRHILEANNWAIEPSEFIQMTATTLAKSDDLYELIGVSFNDPRMANPKWVQIG